jgi:predicted DsbA family dithiol-disulfide isomerase
MTGRVVVSIVSDTICPWCFVAKRNLDVVAKKLGDKVKVEQRWLPYLLYPDAPTTPVSKLEQHTEKYGPANVKKFVAMLTTTFEAVGLTYSIGVSVLE